MLSLDEKIDALLNADFDVHHIFKEIVSRKSVFTSKEDIIDIIFIKRQHLNERDKNSKISKKAKLLVATTKGIIYVEEGFKEITDNYLGYKIKHVNYDKISSYELDISLLDGNFKIIVGSTENSLVEIKFNASKYYNEFEHFFEVLHKLKL